TLQDSNGDGLFESVDQQAYVTTYTYDGVSRRLASLVQGDGTSVAFTYVQVGTDFRVDTITDGEGRVTRINYGQLSQETVVVPVNQNALQTTDTVTVSTDHGLNSAALLTTKTTTTTITVPPYYIVQSGDTFASIATLLYGDASVATQLATALGNPVLTAGT